MGCYLRQLPELGKRQDRRGKGLSSISCDRAGAKESSENNVPHRSRKKDNFGLGTPGNDSQAVCHARSRRKSGSNVLSQR